MCTLQVRKQYFKLHPVTFCTSAVCSFFFLCPLFSSVPFTISSPLSASADAYRTPSMCGCRGWAPACQKCCIVFILSEHGPGWLVIALHADTHAQRNHMSSLSIRLCQWEAAGCHNEQSPHKETSEDKQRLLSRTWLECVCVHRYCVFAQWGKQRPNVTLTFTEAQTCCRAEQSFSPTLIDHFIGYTCLSGC